MKNDVNVPSKSNKQKNLFFFIFFFVGVLMRSVTKIAGSASKSGSISQRHGSADPDLHKNGVYPEHWLLGCFLQCCDGSGAGSEFNGLLPDPDSGRLIWSALKEEKKDGKISYSEELDVSFLKFGGIS